MAVCRRCGAQVDAPGGLLHRPDEARLDRWRQWLDAQSRQELIDRGRTLLKK